MVEPKPFASLTSGLLARKGGATPAMRRQISFGQDDLGWNDMGHDGFSLPEQRVVTGLTPMSAPADIAPTPPPVVPDVVKQRRKLEKMIAAPAKPVRAKPAFVATPQRNRAAFTLRLDAERHLRLRLASAVSHRSAQQLVTEALDAFLENVPGLDALVEQAWDDVKD